MKTSLSPFMLWVRANPRPLHHINMGGPQEQKWPRICSNSKHEGERLVFIPYKPSLINQTTCKLNILGQHYQNHHCTGLTIRIGIHPRLVRKCAAVAPRSDASYFPVISIQCNQWSTRITLHFQNTWDNYSCMDILWYYAKPRNRAKPGRCRFLPPWTRRKSFGKSRFPSRTTVRCTSTSGWSQHWPIVL